MAEKTGKIKFTGILFLLLVLTTSLIHGQDYLYQKGITADQNLKAIANLAPFTVGGVGFDTRYEGVKGSSRLFDTLQTAYVKIDGQEQYLRVDADIEQVKNILLFKHPVSGKLLAIPAAMVTEAVIMVKGTEEIYRTADSKIFDKSLKDKKFYRVLCEKPYLFIKLPVKTFTQADYKGLYTSDKRYDEWGTVYRYYIVTGTNNDFTRVQLNKKSLIKLFPDRKDIINAVDEAQYNGDEEQMIVDIIKKL